jgi:phospholipid transport system substrate-binding protein
MQFASHTVRCYRLLVGACLSTCLTWALVSGVAQADPAKKAAPKAGPAKADGHQEDGPAAPGPSQPPPGTSPMADLKKSNAALRKLFQKPSPSWSPEQDVKRSEMRKIVSGFLDFEELAHRALARHWDTISPKQRTEFVGVLRDLIERNYIKQVHGQPNYDLRFRKEAVTDGQATVNATLDTSAEGKKVTIEMEYKLLFKGGKWLVYDVITDEQSMLENYRAEFNKIITKESFDALLKRMKKRLEKAE